MPKGGAETQTKFGSTWSAVVARWEPVGKSVKMWELVIHLKFSALRIPIHLTVSILLYFCQINHIFPYLYPIEILSPLKSPKNALIFDVYNFNIFNNVKNRGGYALLSYPPP